MNVEQLSLLLIVCGRNRGWEEGGKKREGRRKEGGRKGRRGGREGNGKRKGCQRGEASWPLAGVSQKCAQRAPHTPLWCLAYSYPYWFPYLEHLLSLHITGRRFSFRFILRHQEMKLFPLRFSSVREEAEATCLCASPPPNDKHTSGSGPGCTFPFDAGSEGLLNCISLWPIS